MSVWNNLLDESARKSILVVDDEHMVRLSVVALVKHILGNGKADIHQADGVKAALAKLQAKRFDLVISDVSMKDGNGGDILEAHPKQPILFMTGHRDVKRVGKSTDVIHKPFDMGELDKALSRFLGEGVEDGVNKILEGEAIKSVVNLLLERT
jgi:DNA-binding NtrC family response regulator